MPRKPGYWPKYYFQETYWSDGFWVGVLEALRNIKIMISDIWKNADAKVIRVSGEWKAITSMKVKVSGTWKNI